MQCSVKIGYFLARACEETAMSFCDMCRQAVCQSHLRPSGVSGGTGVVCIPCFQKQASPGPGRRNDGIDSFSSSSSSISSRSSSSSSRSSSDADFSGEGGEFGGGGSSGNWVPAAEIGSGAVARSGNTSSSDLPLGAAALQLDEFSADDIASFDEVGGADKGVRKSEVYDS